jgi:hemerythrin-like domain-containing protein
MNIIDALLGEHGALYAALDCVERTAVVAASLSEVRAQASFLGAAVQAHSHLEDELLFAVVESHVASAEGVIKSMRRMHADIDDALARLPALQDVGLARDLLLSVAAMAREHFSAEEEFCFPQADQTLAPDMLDRLGAAWAERRGITVA